MTDIFKMMEPSHSKVIREKPRHKQKIIDKTILLIEDSASLSHLLAKMLTARWGCEVIRAFNKQEAIEAISEYEGDIFLAISDLNLPDAPNGEVIDVLVEQNIPTIAVTANMEPESIELVRSKGVIDYVFKDSINAYSYVCDLVGRLYSNSFQSALVVSDSDSERDKIGDTLSQQFLTVSYSNDEKRVLNELANNPKLKLIVICFRNKSEQTAKLVTAIRRQYDVKKVSVIVFYSRFDGKHLPELSLKLGANDVLSMPFSQSEFASRVSHHLDLQDVYHTLEFLAFHDELTGLYNRRAYFEHATEIHRKILVQPTEFALLMIDIDHFKDINDHFGHDVGDLVIKDFAHQLQGWFKGDTIARIGGEEFVVLTTQPNNMQEKTQKFIQHISSRELKIIDNVLKYTVSIGLTQFIEPTIDATMRVADTYLYQAKNGGRNKLIAD